MTELVPIVLEFEEKEQPIVLEIIEKETPIALYIQEINSATYDEYKGDYVAIPKVIAQSFPTKNMLMKEDFLVTEIPYDETHNEFGITAVIAS